MAYSPNDEMPAERPLKAYAFDPSQGRNPCNYMTVNVRNEASEDCYNGKICANGTQGHDGMRSEQKNG